MTWKKRAIDPTAPGPALAERLVDVATAQSAPGFRSVFGSHTVLPAETEAALDAMPDAAMIRYCGSDGGQCLLASVSGLPVSSFELRLGGH